MKIPFPALTLAVALSALSSTAQAAPSASDLGLVLAYEEICGLQFDPAAITAYVEANVPADDLAFPGKLQSATRFQRNTAKPMTDSERAALCTQVGRVAKALGFAA